MTGDRRFDRAPIGEKSSGELDARADNRPAFEQRVSSSSEVKSSEVRSSSLIIRPRPRRTTCVASLLFPVKALLEWPRADRTSGSESYSSSHSLRETEGFPFGPFLTRLLGLRPPNPPSILSSLERSLGTCRNVRLSVATGELAVLGTGEVVRLRDEIAPSVTSRLLDSFEPDFLGEGRSTQSKVCRLDCDDGIGDGVLGRVFKALSVNGEGFSFVPVTKLRHGIKSLPSVQLENAFTFTFGAFAPSLMLSRDRLRS